MPRPLLPTTVQATAGARQDDSGWQARIEPICFAAYNFAMMPNTGFASVARVCAYLDLCKTTVYAMMRDGQLVYVMIRGRRRIRWSSVNALIRKRHKVGK